MFIAHIESQDQLPILIPGAYTTRALALSALNANLEHLGHPPLATLTHHAQDDMYSSGPGGDQPTLSCWITELPVNPPDSVDLVSHTLSSVRRAEDTREDTTQDSGAPQDVYVTVQVPTLMHENHRVRVNAPLGQAGAAALAHVRSTNGQSDDILLIGADDHVDTRWADAVVLGEPQPVRGA